jgi:type II secretory pathway component HofQ
VGFLFKQNLKLDDRRELLIFITPKIIKEGLSLRQ